MVVAEPEVVVIKAAEAWGAENSNAAATPKKAVKRKNQDGARRVSIFIIIVSG